MGNVGIFVGLGLGSVDGIPLGLEVGTTDGGELGDGLGTKDGIGLGNRLGGADGPGEGLGDGMLVGGIVSTQLICTKTVSPLLCKLWPQ